MKFTPEHEALRQTWKTLIDREINPNVDEWEKEGAFPAHELFKKMGDAGLLGVDKPVEYGGSGLDFSYAMICAESLGPGERRLDPDGDGRADLHGDAGARPLRQRRAAPGVPGALDQRRLRRLPRRLGDRRRLRRRLDQDHGPPRRRRLGDQRRQDVDDQRRAGRLDVPAGQHRRRPGPQEQVADRGADEDQGRPDRQEARQARHARVGHRADLLRRGEGAGALHDRRSRARASSTRCSSSRRSGCGPAPAR